jgi:iron complex transport system substrate-binding protein
MTVDNCGRQITFDKRPERVLAIGPEAATLLAEAGAADRISSYSGVTADVPFGEADRAVKAAQQLTEDFTLETIIGARPDVVIGYLIGDSTNYEESLAANGIQMLFVSGVLRGSGLPARGRPLGVRSDQP